MTESRLPTVLVIDDEPAILSSLQRLLRREFNVLLAHSGEEGLALMRSHEAQVIISDQRMPGMSGSEFLTLVANEYPDAIRLLLTGYADLDSVIAAINKGEVYRYLVKPWNPDELRGIVREAMEKYRLIVQNRHLMQAVIDAQEHERGRLARELHDDIGQGLTALVLALGVVQEALPESAARDRHILEDATALAENMMTGLRRVIADLRPAVLDDLGLVPALQRLGSELQERTGVVVAVQAEQNFERLPSQLETTLFRVAQEALNNIGKHARASQATVVLAREPGRVKLLVQDNGIGLPAVGEANPNQGNGQNRLSFGLLGIQERVALLSGSFRVESSPRAGTAIYVELPFAGVAIEPNVPPRRGEQA